MTVISDSLVTFAMLAVSGAPGLVLGTYAGGTGSGGSGGGGEGGGMAGGGGGRGGCGLGVTVRVKL